MKTRKKSGATLAEFAAVLILGTPLLLLLMYVAIETTHFFAIKAAMDVGAREAARFLVVDFNKTRIEKTTVDLATWGSFLKMPNYIANNGQFTVAWDTAINPTQCSVTCTYGGAGVAPFPGGPLTYLTQNASFDLSTIQIRGTYTMPVQ
jgi:Flp pilus assembly protein TadG